MTQPQTENEADVAGLGGLIWRRLIDYEKCSHGKKYKGEECHECDARWYEMTMSKSERRLVDSLRAVLEICRQWEPDSASGKDRNTLARAQSLLPPNVELRGGGEK